LTADYSFNVHVSTLSGQKPECWGTSLVLASIHENVNSKSTNISSVGTGLIVWVGGKNMEDMVHIEILTDFKSNIAVMAAIFKILLFCCSRRKSSHMKSPPLYFSPLRLIGNPIWHYIFIWI